MLLAISLAEVILIPVPYFFDEIIIYKSNITLGDEGVSWFENKTIESLGFDLKSSLKINGDSKETYLKRS